MDEPCNFQATRANLSDTLATLLTKPRFRRRVNKLDETGLSPLHYAARYNTVRCAKILIDKGKASEQFIN